jgi:hypothetical protein
MRKAWRITIIGVVVVVTGGIFIVSSLRRTRMNTSLARMVAERGAPSFLAKSLEFQKRGKLLAAMVRDLDPQTVSNWNEITNTVAVWVKTEVGQENVRYFFEKVQNNETFDGRTWYSSRSLFGERVTVAKIDHRGKVEKQKTFRMANLEMTLQGFVWTNQVSSTTNVPDPAP